MTIDDLIWLLLTTVLSFGWLVSVASQSCLDVPGSGCALDAVYPVPSEPSPQPCRRPSPVVFPTICGFLQSTAPTNCPSFYPTSSCGDWTIECCTTPTSAPTALPSQTPSSSPSSSPTSSPSTPPTSPPTPLPTSSPTSSPTPSPTSSPTSSPSASPTLGTAEICGTLVSVLSTKLL